MSWFQLDPESIANRARAVGMAAPTLGASILRGALGFAIVSMGGFTPWVFFGSFFRRTGGEGGMYAACALTFIVLSGLFLHRLTIGPGSLGRFYKLFGISFAAYAVAWIIGYMALRGYPGSFAGLFAGSIAMGLILCTAFDAMPKVMPVVVALFVFNCLGYFWQHQIGTPLPDRLPFEDNTLHEAVLEGTANMSAAADGLPALLAEVKRALRPGGELRLHGLSGDAPLTEASPPLPGPASVVERVPSHREIVAALEAAGFSSVHFEQLSETAHFNVGGVGLREILVSGKKPGHRSSQTSRTATYLGPLAAVTDDFRNNFQRGQPVPLNPHDWQALSRSPAAGHFLLL